jgi:mevalonate kinase
MSVSLSVPGKSFLAGEYLALNGGPAILISTLPKFELRVRNGAGWSPNIHKDSPAGKLIRKHAAFFNQFDLEFYDPHMGRGGWGASTAQFLTCYALLQWQDATVIESEKDFDTHKMVNAYRELAWNGHGIPPSGADLVGQLEGGITYFDRKRGQISQLKWGFHDLEFFLVPTGNKVPTHEHIAKIGAVVTEDLEVVVRQIQESMIHHNKERFIEGINLFAQELDRRQWVYPKTKELLEQYRAIPGVRAAKGCGALGADVVFVAVEKDKSVLFEALLKDSGKRYFTRHHLSNGLHVRVEGEMKINTYVQDISP